MSRIAKLRILVGIILLIALSIRIWGLNYDLPYIYHPDEPVSIGIAYHMLSTGDLSPHFYDWPSLIFYVNLLVQAIYYKVYLGIGSLTAANGPLISLAMGTTYTGKPMLILLERLVSVFLGVGTTGMVIWAGIKISKKPAVGLLAGLIMAISPTNVSLSRFITPDTYSTFFLVAVFLASIYILQDGVSLAYIFSGICLGLAVSSKYNSGMILIVILAAHFIRTGMRGFKDYRLYLAFVLAAVAFFATTPYAILDFHNFYAGFSSTGIHYSTGHPGMEGNPLGFYVGYMGKTAALIYILALTKILHNLYVRSREIILLSFFPVAYFIFIINFTVRNDRTFLPVTPFAFLLAAVLIIELWSKARTISSKNLRLTSTLVVAGLSIFSLVLPVLRTYKDTKSLLTVNNRETARVWINENLPPGAKIALESYSPFVDPNRFSPFGFGRMIDHEPAWYISQNFEYLILSPGMYARFFLEPEKYPLEISQYNAFFEQFHLVKLFPQGLYEIRIYKVGNSP